MPRTAEIKSFKNDILKKMNAISIFVLLILFANPILSQTSAPDKISDLLSKIDTFSYVAPPEVYLEFKEILHQAPSDQRIRGIYNAVLLCSRSEIFASTNCSFETVSAQAQEWITLYKQKGDPSNTDELQIETSGNIYALYSKKHPMEFARYIDQYIEPLIQNSSQKKKAFRYYGFYYSTIFKSLNKCPKVEGRSVFKKFMEFLPLYLASGDISDLNKNLILKGMASYCTYWGYPEVAERVIDNYMKGKKIETWPAELLFRKFLILILGHGDRKTALEYLKVMETRSLLGQLTEREEEYYQLMLYQINKHMLFSDQQLIENSIRTLNKSRSNFPNMEYILCVK